MHEGSVDFTYSCSHLLQYSLYFKYTLIIYSLDNRQSSCWKDLLNSMKTRGDVLDPGLVNLNSVAEAVRTVNIMCPASGTTPNTC